MWPLAGPTFDASTPPLAQTKPCSVSVMITPRAIRTTRRASRRTTSIWRGSRSQRSANATASGRGSIAVEVDDRALGLRDDLLGDDEDVVGAEREDAWRSPRSRRRSAPPRSSPATISGIPASAMASTRPSLGRGRRRPSRSVSRRRGPASRSTGGRLSRHRPAVARPRRWPRLRLREEQVVGRVEVERERPAEDDEPGVDGRAAASWAIALSPPKHRSIASGGAISRAFVPRPWRSGTSATSGRSGSSSAAATASIAAAVTSGRSIGRMRIASAPAAIASPRAATSPWLRPRRAGESDGRRARGPAPGSCRRA